MKYNELLNEIKESGDNAVVSYIQSYQYQMSLKILKTRIRKELTEQEAADKVGMDLTTYLSFENGTNRQATKDDYAYVLKKLQEYPIMRITIFNKSQQDTLSYLFDRHNNYTTHDSTEDSKKVPAFSFHTDWGVY